MVQGQSKYRLDRGFGVEWDGGMRKARYKLKGEGYYYLRTETLGGMIRFSAEEREFLMRLAVRASEFTGVDVLECAVLPTGIQLVVVADPKERADTGAAELVARYRALYGGAVGCLGYDADQLEQVLAKGGADAREARRVLLARMHDISQLMKTIKQRFTSWYNRRHNRRGTLWTDRFQSVLLEPQPNTVGWYRASVQSAPVRAGEVFDPYDYRWSTAGPGGWRGIRCFSLRRELRAWTARAVEEALSWLLAPTSQIAQIKGNRCPPRELEAALARRVIAGSEAFVRRHQARWSGVRQAVPIEEVGTSLWAARGWRRRLLGYGLTESELEKREE